jgi:cytidylate kinase
MIVAIDGEVGSGKTTVAGLVAEKLGAPLLESGSIYRALAWKAIREGTDISEDELAALAENTAIEVEFSRHGNRVKVDGTDVTGELRGPEMDKASSDVSRFRRVRKVMLGIQRKAARKGCLVAEGRDMGTIVFPDADFKFFLTASLDVRAERHRRQMEAVGRNVPFEEVVRQVENRDANDTRRVWSPMVPAKDAVLIDTTDVDAESVAALILQKVEAGA